MKNEFVIKDYTFCKSDKFHVHKDVTDSILSETLAGQYDYIKNCIDHNIFNISVTHVFSHVIGVAHCVECPPRSKGVYFKQRGNRPYLSRMVRGVEPKASYKCTLIIRYNCDSKTFVIITAWIGDQSKPELGNINYFEYCSDPMKEIMESAEFWMNHALIEE